MLKDHSLYYSSYCFVQAVCICNSFSRTFALHVFFFLLQCLPSNTPHSANKFFVGLISNCPLAEWCSTVVVNKFLKSCDLEVEQHSVAILVEAQGSDTN